VTDKETDDNNNINDNNKSKVTISKRSLILSIVTIVSLSAIMLSSSFISSHIIPITNLRAAAQSQFPQTQTSKLPTMLSTFSANRTISRMLLEHNVANMSDINMININVTTANMTTLLARARCTPPGSTIIYGEPGSPPIKVIPRAPGYRISDEPTLSELNNIMAQKNPIKVLDCPTCSAATEIFGKNHFKLFYKDKKVICAIVTIPIRQTFPDYPGVTSLSSCDQQEWRTFLDALHAHEQGHVDNIHTVYDGINSQLIGKTKAQVLDVVKAAAIKFNLIDGVYEMLTDHGATQGARLNLNPTDGVDKNCGACGDICTSSMTCQSGSCQCPAGQQPDPITGKCGCPAGQTSCNGQCVDPATFQSDPNNCGRCGTICGGGMTCQSGSCSCPIDKPTICGGQCTNTNTDPNNCIECGTVCSQYQCGNPAAGIPYHPCTTCAGGGCNG
jgi:predicted secreted Zn-dependent protease